MIHQTMKHKRTLAVLACAIALVSWACQLTDLVAPQPTSTAAAPTGAADGSAEPVTPPPTTLPGFAPGTIIIDQTSSLSATLGSSVEMSFESVPLQTVSIEATLASGALTYQLYLADQYGNFIGEFRATDTTPSGGIAEFTLPYDGTYSVILSPISGEGTVRIVVTALASASGGGQLNGVGDSEGGLFSIPGTYHTFQMPLNQGEVVSIAARANVAGAPDTRLTFYGPDGRLIAEADDVLVPIDLDAVLGGFTVPSTGTYTAIVTHYGDAMGAYIFAVTTDTLPPQVEGPPDITYDSEFRARFFEGSNLSLTFDGAVGDAVKIEAFNPEEAVDLDIYLYSPFGQIIAYAVTAQAGRAETINEVQLPYTGRYRLELRPTGEGEASFRVSHLPADSLTGGGVFGDSVSGVFPGVVSAANVFHFYQFNATAGDNVSLLVFSVNQRGQLDIGFAVLGPNGRQLVFADDSESDNPFDPELIDFEITQTGTYTVIVYSHTDGTGSYDLEYSRE